MCVSFVVGESSAGTLSMGGKGSGSALLDGLYGWLGERGWSFVFTLCLLVEVVACEEKEVGARDI